MLKVKKILLMAGLGVMLLLGGCAGTSKKGTQGTVISVEKDDQSKDEHLSSDEKGRDSDENGNDYRYVSTEGEGDTPLFDTAKPVNILFAGNSLLKTPKTNEYFEKLVERYQLPVNLVSELWDGMNIRYQVSIAGSNMLDVGEEYRNADILLIQEYGNHYETTYDDLCELIENYCKDDVIVYYYTTEWDYPARYLQKISDDARIHILDFGSVQNKLNEMKAPGEESMYDYLHLKNDYHPNELNGFLAAAYIYTQVYKTGFDDFGYEELDSSLKNLLPGENEEEKTVYYDEMIRIINDSP